MHVPDTPTMALIGTGISILLLCIGIAVVIAAGKGLIDVKIRTGLHIGRRPPP